MQYFLVKVAGLTGQYNCYGKFTELSVCFNGILTVLKIFYSILSLKLIFFLKFSIVKYHALFRGEFQPKIMLE